MAKSSRSGGRGWVAPKGGGYSFGSPRKDRNGRYVQAQPPRGSGGIGNLHRKKESE